MGKARVPAILTPHEIKNHKTQMTVNYLLCLVRPACLHLPRPNEVLVRAELWYNLFFLTWVPT